MHIFVFLLAFFDVICALNITLLHTNDVHGRFEQTDLDGFKCDEADRENNACFGGLARLAGAINEIRSTEDNVLLMDAGDRLAGTIWSDVYKGNATDLMVNYLNYTAITLGNHDFDYGLFQLQHFLTQAKCDVVVSNLNTTNEPKWQNSKIKKSVIVDVGGEKVGIVGYIVTSTPRTSNSGSNIHFLSIIESVQKAVDDLVAKGITRIIVLGHGGLSQDKEIAKKVKGVDIVVGGHSHTFLYTGDPPSTEKPDDLYPVIVHPEYNKTLSVPVVQDYKYCKYLGHLKITFNKQGDVISYQGNPILLNHDIVEDPKVKKVVGEMKEFLDKRGNTIVGQSKVKLDGSRKTCSSKPCPLGKLMAAAMVYHYRSHKITIGLYSGQSIRKSLSTDSEGNIFYRDLFSSFPYSNSIDLVELSGEDITASLESGSLQIQGLSVKYNKSFQPQRESVKVLQFSCPSTKSRCYKPIESNKIYKVAVNSYLVTYSTLSTMKAKNRRRGDSVYDVLVEYLKHNSPLTNDKTNHGFRPQHDLFLIAILILWCITKNIEITI